jgi:hypothetical protein
VKFNKGAINKKWVITIIIMIVNLSLTVAILASNLNNQTENQTRDVGLGWGLSYDIPESARYLTLPYKVKVKNFVDEYFSGLTLSAWVIRDDGEESVVVGTATDQQLGTLKPESEIRDIEMSISFYYEPDPSYVYSTHFQLSSGNTIIAEAQDLLRMLNFR